MNRREVLQAGVCALVLPSFVRAQAARKPARVAVLSSSTPESRSRFWDAFRDGMEKLGWREGRDVNYIYRYARGDSSRFSALAAELVAEMPDLIYAGTGLAAQAVRRTTREIPIVFAFVADPIGLGLVASLARPGGNATGMASMGGDLILKNFELLRDIRPGLRRIAVLVSSGPAGERAFGEIERAARALHIQAERVVVAIDSDVIKALQSLDGKRLDGALSLGPAGITVRKQVVERLAQLRLPMVHSLGEMVEGGALIAYGASIEDNYRRAATYVDAILKGARPADLPVQLPTTFELWVNLKAARDIGITIPQKVLLRATKVIE